MDSGVLATTAGIAYICALPIGGSMMGCEGNALGQLGDSTTLSSITPVDVTGVSSGTATIVAEPLRL